MTTFKEDKWWKVMMVDSTRNIMWSLHTSVNNRQRLRQCSKVEHVVFKSRTCRQSKSKHAC